MLFKKVWKMLFKKTARRWAEAQVADVFFSNGEMIFNFDYLKIRMTRFANKMWWTIFLSGLAFYVVGFATGYLYT